MSTPLTRSIKPIQNPRDQAYSYLPGTIARIDALVNRPKVEAQPVADRYGVLLEINKCPIDLVNCQRILEYIYATPSLAKNESILNCLLGYSLSQAKTWLLNPSLALPLIQRLPQALVRSYLKYLNLSDLLVSAAILERLLEPLATNVDYQRVFETDNLELGRNRELCYLVGVLNEAQRATVPKGVWNRVFSYLLNHPEKQARETGIAWLGKYGPGLTAAAVSQPAPASDT